MTQNTFDIIFYKLGTILINKIFSVK